MIDRATTKRPIASFALPPCAPPAVAKANESFCRVADEWAGTSGELDDALETKNAAVAGAQRAVVEDVKTGKPSAVDPAAVAAEHDAIIAAMRAKLDALTIAVDESGNELANSAAECRDEWIVALVQNREAAAARFDAAIAEARDALKDLAPTRRAVEWLESFDAGLARVGQQQQFTGGGIRVRDSEFVRGIHSEPQDPFKLLDLVATATALTEPAAPRTHRTAVGSSMR